MKAEIKTYLEERPNWKNEILELRKIALDCGLQEDYKWRNPCYTDNEKNIILIFNYKDYTGISFFKGALLKDEKGLLFRQTQHMQAVRQLRFTSLEEIIQQEDQIKHYIVEAINIERAGLEVKHKTTAEFVVPDELSKLLKENKSFSRAFNGLTEGRKRGYLLYFSKPKKSVTRLSRIEGKMNRIMNGYGLNDCICGRSKNKPNCDGSHNLPLK